MNDYNLVIIENKQRIPFLNLTEQAFYDKLWEWTWVDDLWDYIDDSNPTEEDLNNVLYQFIEENVFHKWEDDNVDCFAFINTDEGIKEYQIDNMLIEFIKSKIEETTYSVLASNEEEAEALVLSGNYDQIIDDTEEGEMEDCDVINIEQS